jgi:predicted aldo/keto reductase-like oxidoreductase
MKKLGFGLMRLPLLNADNRSEIDIETMKKMVDCFIERGFTYFDTAYPYHDGKSEEAMREALVRRYPREAFTVTDKLPCWEINTADDMERIFNVQLERCGVDYFDYYWLHSMCVNYCATMDRVDGYGFIAKKKAEGKIRHIGFSFHDTPELLERILTEHPEMEIVQLQINYLDWDSPTIESRKCYEIARRHGKKIIVMEPVKGGALAKVPASAEKLFRDYAPDASSASWAVRYAASLPGVMMVLSGMSNEQQMNDNTSYMSDFKPLNNEELGIIANAKSIIEGGIAIPCTACHYCTDGCPQHIAIPEYFSCYNTLSQFGEVHRINSTVYYNATARTHGKASDCIECGQCEEHCPQHIHIIDELKKVAQEFD